MMMGFSSLTWYKQYFYTMAKTHAWPGGHRGRFAVSKRVTGVCVSRHAQGDCVNWTGKSGRDGFRSGQRQWGARLETLRLTGRDGDTPQAPYPHVDQSRPTVSDAYRSSYAECWCDDSLHTQSQQQFTLYSYASNYSNARRSQSVPPIIVFTLVSYDTPLSLIIFKIIPHPMTLLTVFPLQVIILHFI
jgi:hypothetical protein